MEAVGVIKKPSFTMSLHTRNAAEVDRFIRSMLDAGYKLTFRYEPSASDNMVTSLTMLGFDRPTDPNCIHTSTSSNELAIAYLTRRRYQSSHLERRQHMSEKEIRATPAQKTDGIMRP
jgi:hypothetical protein